MIKAWVPLLIASVAPAAAQTTDFFTWADGIALNLLSQRQAAVSSIQTVQAADQRKAFVRGQLAQIFGALPLSTAPLNAQITNTIQQSGFQIQTLIFQSSPGYFVTADVYIPSSPGPHPAIVDQVGHYSNSKAEEQLIASNLALKGFAVLVFDPVGQGERLQGQNFTSPPADPGVYQHLMAGAQTILTGQTLARYMVSDAVRAIDYLSARTDVDPTRIGAIGCSGGGVMTEYTAALDSRIKAVAAACSMNVSSNTFTNTGDSEQSPMDLISYGLDYPDFAEVVAPEPYLILTTTEDDPAAPTAAYNEASAFYNVYGAANNIQLVIGPGPHGQPVEDRQALYAWMIRWIGDGVTDPTEVAVSLVPDASLQATASGLAGGQQIYQILDQAAGSASGTLQEMLSFLQNQMPYSGFQPIAGAPEITDGGTYWIDAFTFETQPGLLCSARLLTPKVSGPKPAVIFVNTDNLGSAAANALAAQGNVVLDLLPRGLPSDIGADYYYTDWLSGVRAQLIGGNLAAMRAYDIRQAVQLLQTNSEVDPTRISGQASGVGGIWLLIAASLENGLSSLSIDSTPYSFRAALNVPVHYDLFPAALQGFAVNWDISNLVSALGRRPIQWTNPTDWLRNPVPESTLVSRLTGSLAAHGTVSGQYYVDLEVTNAGPAAAIGISAQTITLRALSGSGAVSVATPLPLTIGDIQAGASVTTRVFLNVPASVTRFSIAESLAWVSSTGQPLNVSLSQSSFR